MKNAISYFIPKTVTVGKVADESKFRDISFITCRYKYQCWISPSVFERVSGFKPTNQQDRAMQLRKEVANAVFEVENVPTEGFKIVSWLENPYDFRILKYEYTGDIVLSDPRGFLFAMPEDSFFSSLRSCGFNMKDGVLSGKFSYAWDTDHKLLALVSEADPMYGKWKAASDATAIRKKSAEISVSKRDLVPGKVYRAAKVLKGDWMYVGVYDTYSYACHMDAYDNGGRYDIEKFIDSENGMLREKWTLQWPTTKGKMIFYSMTPQMQQYVIRSDVSGIFSGEVMPDPDAKMYNSEKPATTENVLDDVSRNPGFQLIAFNEKRKPVQMPFSAFSFYFGENRFKSFDTGVGFPFYRARCHSLINSGGKFFKIKPSSHGIIWTICDVTAYSQSVYNRMSLVKSVHASCKDIYDKYMPLCEDLRFKNGNDVDPIFSAVFCPKDVCDAASSIYI